MMASPSNRAIHPETFSFLAPLCILTEMRALQGDGSPLNPSGLPGREQFPG
jgi:hypothetical protein